MVKKLSKEIVTKIKLSPGLVEDVGSMLSVRSPEDKIVEKREWLDRAVQALRELKQ